MKHPVREKRDFLIICCNNQCKRYGREGKRRERWRTLLQQLTLKEVTVDFFNSHLPGYRRWGRSLKSFAWVMGTKKIRNRRQTVAQRSEIERLRRLQNDTTPSSQIGVRLFFSNPSHAAPS